MDKLARTAVVQVKGNGEGVLRGSAAYDRKGDLVELWDWRDEQGRPMSVEPGSSFVVTLSTAA